MNNYKNTQQKKAERPITNSGCGPNGKWSRRFHLFSMLLMLLMMAMPAKMHAGLWANIGPESTTIDTQNLAKEGYFTLSFEYYDSFNDVDMRDEFIVGSKFYIITNDYGKEEWLNVRSTRIADDRYWAQKKEQGPYFFKVTWMAGGWTLVNSATGGYTVNDWEEVSTSYSERDWLLVDYGKYKGSHPKERFFWGNVGSKARINLRVYVPSKYIGKDFTIQFDGTIGMERSNGEKVNKTKSISVRWPEQYTKINASFVPSKTKGQIDFKYTYPGGSNIGYIKWGSNDWSKLNQSGNGFVGYVSNTPSSFTAYVNMLAGNEANEYAGRRDFQNTNTNYNSTKPAYVWPESIQPTFDDKGYVNLKFKMPYSSGYSSSSYITGGNIEIQRATASDFSDAVTLPNPIPYDYKQIDYSYSDDIRKENLKGTLYYRFRRSNTKADWGWDYYKSTSVTVNSELSTITNLTAVVDIVKNKEVPSARLNWTFVEKIWPEGSTFRIVAHNKTTGQKSNIANLTIEDARKGVYWDEALLPCNKMNYSMQFNIPQGTKYIQPDPIMAKGDVLTAEIGNISDLEVSKGYFADRVDLKWKVIGGFDAFRIRRVEYGTQDTITIDNINSTASEVMLASDEKGAPGVYYRYIVDGMVVCDKTPVYSNVLSSIGFRSPTGNIYGRLTYKNGQPVADADVLVESDKPLGGKSILFDGQDDYLIAKENIELGDSFTVQAYVAPENTNLGTVLCQEGVYELKLNRGKWEFTAGSKTVSTPYVTKTGLHFTHVSAVKEGKNLLLYIDGEKESSITDAAVASTDSAATFIGCHDSANFFQGRIDEVRLWNEALNKDVIKRDYTRQLYGGEKGLQAYWRFNDGIADEFYDLACTGNDYHQNHGKIHGARYDDLIPAQSQLALKGVTDDRGNYSISGVPYTGQGTMYRIIPRKGTHQFDPAHHQRMVANGAVSHTCDFTDNSSFSVSGHIYYENSTIPVAKAMFKVDGQPVMNNFGEAIETDERGRFTISVPVGKHNVRVYKHNHTFVNEGQIIDLDGGDLDYQNNIEGIKLYDKTRVKFIGRVAGGAIQDAYPLGHSLSTNNLSESLKITMQLTAATGQLYTGSSDLVVTDTAYCPSNRRDDLKKWGKEHFSTTRYNIKDNTIEITPDLKTGEFVAYLFPENYKVNSVNVVGYDNILETITNIDLSKVFVELFSKHDYKDSVEVKKEWFTTEYHDSVSYNYAHKFIKRQQPTIELKQVVKNKVQDFFGDEINVTNAANKNKLSYQVYDKHKKEYLFGYPVYGSKMKYVFRLAAFEEFPFFDKRGKRIKDRTDRVPVADGIANFNNRLSNTGRKDTVSLNKEGVAIYEFTTGEPNISDKNPTKNLDVSLTLDTKTIEWSGNPLQAILIGSHEQGKNFVTRGPDQLLFVLRDPPGTHSYSYIEKGSTISEIRNYVGSVEEEGSETWHAYNGGKVITFSGVGAGMIQSTEIDNDNIAGIVHKESIEGTSGVMQTQTFTTGFKTSDEDQYVGAAGDVFIGNATNLTFGNAVSVHIIDKSLYNDQIHTELKTVGDKMLVRATSISFNIEFATTFAYPQAHIENVLIPQLTQMRNSLLLPNTMSLEEAQKEADRLGKQVYLSRLSTDDENYGLDNLDKKFVGKPHYVEKCFSSGESYITVVPTGKLSENDEIMEFNQEIKGWITALAQNEREKVEAKLMKNYSFHAGSPIEYSEEYVGGNHNEQSFSVGIGATATANWGLKSSGFGMQFIVDEVGYVNNGGHWEQDQSNSVKIGFVLADEGSTDYHSVDVCRAPVPQEVIDQVHNDEMAQQFETPSSFVFKLKGGATSCPYEEGYWTKYFEPGEHQIDQKTAQVEVPKIEAENTVAIDVPASRRAVYKILLGNESEIDSDCAFDLNVIDGSNPNGAKFYIDGTPLGNGRSFVIPAGEKLVKTLEVGMGSSLEYENLQIVLHSQCQYTTLDFKDNIADTLTLSAYFVPSCSDVHLAEPKENWTLNNSSQFINTDGDFILPIKIDGYDANYKNFEAIRIQYKPAAGSDADWVNVMSYYPTKEKFDKAQGAKAMLPEGGVIRYNMNMQKLPDQKYDICAVAVCANDILTVSNVSRGIKDTKRPQLFGAAQPADGILHFEDDVRLNFNEKIAEGLLDETNFEVTGTRNGKVLSHDASLRFDGQNDYLATEASKNFSGKSFTVEMAFNIDQLQHESTLFSHGNISNVFEISLTPDTLLKVKMGDQLFVTDKPVGAKKGEWNHVAVTYDTEQHILKAYVNKNELISRKATNYSGDGIFEIGRSLSTSGNYFCGKISELRVWNQALNNGLITRYKDISLKGSEIDLWAYYPMDECRGKVALDKARGANAIIKDAQWFIGRRGLAAQFDGNAYLQLATGAIPLSKDYDYTVEFWFKGVPGQKNVALVCNGRGDNEEEGGSADKLYIGFNEFGKLILISNGQMQFSNEKDYIDNAWHHYALCVNRGGSNANIYVDGILINHFDAAMLENVSSNFMYLGARAYYAKGDVQNLVVDQYFKGCIDEFRMWNLCKNQTMVNEESNVALKGSEMGLLAYYPFETYRLNPSNIMELDYSLSDAKKQGPNDPTTPNAVSKNTKETAESAPVKERGSIDPIMINFVVNNDALIITPYSANGWNDYEQSIVTFKVKNVQDVNGNTIKSPIAWTAYIDRNQLLWSEDELNLSKQVYEPMTFELDLVNKSGTVQHYSIENQPAWLEVSQEIGSIDPQKSKHIQFTVNEGLNIGSYNEVIYLVNENGVARALELNLKVKGERPDWKVDEKAYNFNMSIFAEMYFDGVPSNDAEDMVGIFKNGECVGMSNSTYDKKRDMWYTYLMIYTNEMAPNNKDMKDVYEFRLWDTSTGMLYLGEVDQLIFDNGNCGSIKNLLKIKGQEMKFRDLGLEKGWNWVSFAVLPSNASNSNMVLKNGSWMNDDVIKNSSAFDTYSEAKQQWVGTIGNTYDRTQMYMVHAGKPQSLYISGTENNNLQIKVEGQKWNYIGYTPAFNLSVNEALAGYKATEGDLIKSQSQFAMYTDGDWVGNLKHMEINKGYMLFRKAKDNVNFTYPTVRGAFGNKYRAPFNLYAENDFNKKYESNMTIIATPVFKDLQAGDRIEAYVNGELRGYSQIVNLGEQDLHFLTISGRKDNEQIVFSLVRQGEEVAKSSRVVPFTANANLGAVNKATEISFDDAEDNVSVYPNPFVSHLHIQFFAEQDGKAEISIYDLAGRLIMQKTLQAHAGVNKYTWNGVTNQAAQCAGGVHIVRVTVDGKTSVHEVIKK